MENLGYKLLKELYLREYSPGEVETDEYVSGVLKKLRNGEIMRSERMDALFQGILYTLTDDEKQKVKAIERIDEFIVGPIIESLEGQDFRAAILPDHPTPISVGTHTRDNVPLVIYDSEREGDECESFDEEGVKKGSLEFREGHYLVQRLIDGDY